MTTASITRTIKGDGEDMSFARRQQEADTVPGDDGAAVRQQAENQRRWDRQESRQGEGAERSEQGFSTFEI